MVTFRSAKLSLLLLALSAVTSSAGFASVSVNSQCYMKTESDDRAVQGKNLEKDFELASVSKMVTTYWATESLGPMYRFSTKLHVTQISPDVFDVHIEGDQDPYFGQHMTYFLVSELNKAGIKNIETLSFDENFDINWNVRHPKFQAARSFDPSPEAVQKTLENVLIKNSFRKNDYQATRKLAWNEFKLEMIADPELKVRKIVSVKKSSVQISQNAKTQILVLKSAPLYRYLKEMNTFSNNYVADLIYAKLGGSDSFRDFIKATLDLDQSSLNFVNGSGDSEFSSDGKLYNKGSCSALIKILFALRLRLEESGLDLPDVMAVSGLERSTLGGRYAGLPGAVVAKTGSVNPAITLSGLISTDQGDLLFAVLMRTGGPADWTRARNQIRSQVGKLIKEHGQFERIKYTAKDFLPFDAKSRLEKSIPALVQKVSP